MKRKKIAIVFGASGQDGAYLSAFLLNTGYKVIGTTRNRSKKNLWRLIKLEIFKKFKLHKGQATDIKFCKKIIKKNIKEIYYLAGDSSVTRSFDQPENSLKSNALGILNILSTVKNKNKKIIFRIIICLPVLNIFKSIGNFFRWDKHYAQNYW